MEMSIRYPDLEKEYKTKCQNQEIKIGELWLYCEDHARGQKILNFPTKNDYKYPSKQEYLELGLQYFRDHYKEYGVNSIAFPLLGANNGKIKPDVALDIMKKYLCDLDDILIEIYSFSKNADSKDILMEQFKDYLKNNQNDKNNRILDYALSAPSNLMFSDIAEAKISELQPDGSTKRTSVATKQYLQKIISSIKNFIANQQSSLL